MLDEPLEQEPTDLLKLGHRLGRFVRLEAVGNGPDPLEVWDELLMLGAEPVADVGPWAAALPRLAVGRSARSALRITATSIASCTSAPPTGSSNPNAPNSIPTNDRPMPITTLWTAIPRERRAIRIASATRSSRSTTKTTSAASDDAVARAPIATPTSAASAGASFTPSPTMIVGPNSPCLHGVHLVGRIPLGQDAVDPDRDADGLGDVRVVAGHHHHAVDPRSPQDADHAGRVRANRVLQDDGAGDLAIDRDHHARRSLHRAAPPDIASLERERCSTRDPASLAEPYVPSVDAPADAGAQLLADVFREDKLEPALPSRGDDRRREHVASELIE